MYIQPKREEAVPQVLPEGYSGSAFSPPVAPPERLAEVAAEAESPQAQAEAPMPTAIPTTAGEEKRSAETTPVGRFPLLSALLPPKRCKKEGGELPEWVLIAAVFLLLFADGEKNDILPFLLLLLLWD